MVSESPCYFASNRVPWPGAPTKWFKTMKYAEGAQFDMERRPQRHTPGPGQEARETQIQHRAWNFLGGGFINKWFKEEDQTRDPEHRRRSGRMPC